MEYTTHYKRDHSRHSGPREIHVFGYDNRNDCVYYWDRDWTPDYMPRRVFEREYE